MELRFRDRQGHWFEAGQLGPGSDPLSFEVTGMRRGDGPALRSLLEQHRPPQLVLERPPIKLIREALEGLTFDSLELRDLRGPGIADALAVCRTVQSLTITGPVTGEQIAALSGSSVLEQLRLTDSRVLWRDLADLLLPALQWLSLEEAPLFDDADYASAIEALEPGPGLARELCARRWPDKVAWPWDLPFRHELDALPGSAEVFDDGPPEIPDPRAWARLARRSLTVAAPIPDLPALAYLGLPKCVFHSTLISAIVGLPQLRVLNLEGTGVQHDELGPLLEHPSLRRVRLGFAVSREDLEEFVLTGIRPPQPSWR